eukprot:1356644-Prymnesium_polylepis.1
MLHAANAAVLLALALPAPPVPYRAELHVHFDGAVPIETLLRVAQQRQLSLPVVGVPKSVADIWTALRSIAPVWRWFDFVNNVIGGDEATLTSIAEEFVARQAANGILYTEVRLDPVRAATSAYSNTSITEARAVAAIAAGLRAGSEKHGVEAHQLLCAMRGKPAAACFSLVELAAKLRTGALGGVVGIDLAGDEYHFNNSKGDVEACFTHAKQNLKLNVTVHAGEMAGPDDVRTAVEDMGADRIGHGYSATADPTLMALLKERQIHVEACPGNHPQNLPDILKYLKDGLNFGINTDDPAEYFGNTSLPQNDAIVMRELDFTTADVAKAYADARAAAFAPTAAAVVAEARAGRRS